MTRWSLPRVGRTLALVALAACGGGVGRDAERDALPADSLATALAAHVPTHVDSVFPPGEEQRRFLAELGRTTDSLRDASRSRDALLARFTQAVAAADESALRAMQLDVVEFAALYYPVSRFARPPYFLKPQTAWFQISANAAHDARILLRRYGGRPLRLAHVDCPATPDVEGSNRLWSGCRVRVAGDTAALQLFGTILERDGRFKFVSLANKL